jgi:hypothetical protein
MANALNSAENKLFADLTKSELANKFVSLSEQIEALKKALKLAETEADQIEGILLPQIGLKYQPKGAEFILMPKVSKGRKSTSYATVVSDAPKVCKFTTSQEAIFADLVTSQTKIGEDKTSIQIVK